MTDGPTICLHITKTAGGTLKTALRAVPGLSVEFLYGPADLDRLKEADLSGTGMIYGHAMFGLHDRLKIAPRYMCFMRHPVTRTISHYYHLRNVDKGPVGDRIRKSTDIDDFFLNYAHWEFSDLMTKIIAGTGPAQVTGPETPLQMAQRHIDAHFSFIGFQEFFPLSVRKMSGLIRSEIQLGGDINIGRYDLKQVSEQTLQRIEALNAVDMQLYRYALDRFL